MAAVLVAAAGGLALAVSNDALSGDEAPPSSYGGGPDGFDYKANAGSLILHAPGQEYYDRTTAERCFSTPEAATAAGFPAAEV